MIVVSMGMLPPTPKPTNAVRMRKVVYVLEAPRHRPKMDENRQVRLNAHRRPGEQLDQSWAFASM